MAYIFNKYIQSKYNLTTGLTKIYGIGSKQALKIANFLCLNPKQRFSKLSADNISMISRHISAKYVNNIAGNLQKSLKQNIQRKIKIRSYQGIRHKNKLPVRGQRTHTNARTQRKTFKHR